MNHLAKIQYKVFLRFLFIAAGSITKDAKNIVRVHPAMLQPPIHEIHSAVQIDASDVGTAGHCQLYQLVLQLERQDFVAIQSQYPRAIERDVIKRPIELNGMIDKCVLHDAATIFSADVQSAVSAERINNDDVVREVFDGFEAAANIRFLIIGEKN